MLKATLLHCNKLYEHIVSKIKMLDKRQLLISKFKY